MSIKITLEFPTLGDAARFLLTAEAVQSATAVGPTIITSEAPLAADPVQPEPARKPRAKKRAEPVPVAEGEAPTHTVDDVRAALNQLMASKGMQPCQDILQRYGVTRISKLLPNRFAEFIAECK